MLPLARIISIVQINQEQDFENVFNYKWFLKIKKNLNQGLWFLMFFPF